MLDRVRGKLLEKSPGRAVIEAAGTGLGLSLLIPLSTYSALPEPGQEASLMARLTIREESWDIFGFGTSLERETFDVLTSVSRVGPKLALTIISAMSPDNLAQALVTQDLPKLAAIKGIGLKTAERLIVELKDKAQKLSSLMGPPGGHQGTPAASRKEEIVQALITLGYTRLEAEKGAWAAASKLGPDADPSLSIREALNALSG
ncbi:MAG: Holliday junction branch migration protein RuvA [Deltaproteobacteria bacterium]|nr:Holliday junction branch migration protein RuvA [Deltaproteobacteria bacterium]